MKQELFCSLDQPWNKFAKSWKGIQRRASEKSVHDLRVNARRFIENLEFARALSASKDVRKLMQRLKKVLKRTSSLRDLQVQLETAAHLPHSNAIVKFTGHLERLERKRITKVGREFRPAAKLRLAKTFKEVRSEFIRSQGNAGTNQTRHSIRRILTKRQNKFLEAKRRFDQSYPHNEEALHQMRIALKKLRYVMEAAAPLLSDSEKEQIQPMHAFQNLMGDSRDLEILRVELEHWANKRGKKLAVIPALRELEEKREALLKKLPEASQELSQSLSLSVAVPVSA